MKQAEITLALAYDVKVECIRAGKASTPQKISDMHFLCGYFLSLSHPEHL